MPPKTKLDAEAEAKGFDFKSWLLEHLKPIVFVGAVVVVAGVGLILFQSLKKQDQDQHWADLLSTTLYASSFTSGEVLDHIEKKASGDVVAHALYQQAIQFTREKEFEKALSALDRLDADFPDSYLTALPSPDMRFPVTGALRRWVEVERDWEKENGYEEPELNTDRVALVETSMGAFWLGFYPKVAPEHVLNFITLAKAGGMNGTSVTRITGSIFEYGGEASRDEDPFNDDPDDETTLLEPGAGRFKVQQDRGSISAVSVEGGESSTRFAVVTGQRAYGLDKKQSIFGRVLNDRYPERSAIDEIAGAVTYNKSPVEEIKDDQEYRKIGDHPVETIRIERVTIWTGDKLEDGHDFDVSEVKKPAKPADEPADEDASDENATNEGAPEEGGETTTDEPDEE